MRASSVHAWTAREGWADTLTVASIQLVAGKAIGQSILRFRAAANAAKIT
jgi:hypothetical protein